MARFCLFASSLYWEWRVLYYRGQSVLEVASSLLQGRVCTGSGGFFTTGANLDWKWRVLYYRGGSVLEMACSLLQGPVCTGSGEFFTTGASLHLQRWLLHGHCVIEYVHETMCHVHGHVLDV